MKMQSITTKRDYEKALALIDRLWSAKPNTKEGDILNILVTLVELYESKFIKELKLENIPDYGEHMTLKNFIKYCEEGCFIDYDGWGKYATKNKMSDKIIRPSDVTGRTTRFDFETMITNNVKVNKNIDKSFSHIVWFNR